MKRIFSLLIIVLLLACSACSVRLDENETYALDILSSYREMLVAPDSMVLKNNIALVRAGDDNGEEHTYCYFTASGTNEQGTELTSTICYLDGEFFCDMEDMAVFLENGMGTTDTVMDIELLIRCRDVLDKYEQWKTDGDQTVNGETVAGKLKIQWETEHD